MEALGLAGVLRLHKEGYFSKGSKVVCILTGHGLKDPEFATKVSEAPEPLPPRIERIVEFLQG